MAKFHAFIVFFSVIIAKLNRLASACTLARSWELCYKNGQTQIVILN